MQRSMEGILLQSAGAVAVRLLINTGIELTIAVLVLNKAYH